MGCPKEGDSIMERELWCELYRAVVEVGKVVRQKGVRYQPWVIALVYLWAALHERHVAWACEAPHWSTTRLRPLAIPSPATMSRRTYSQAMAVFWRRLEEQLRGTEPAGLLAFVDGKPLVVGNASKDRDARRGFAVNGFAKGYRLHVIQSNRVLPETWDVTPMNVSEQVVARTLVQQSGGGGYLLGDKYYDATAVYDDAWSCGYQLIAPHEPGAGQGHRPQSQARLRGIELAQRPFGQELLAQRRGVEQTFGNLTSFAGGLGPLPAWVRRLSRVRTWVWAKLLINAVRIERLKHQHLAA
jgi:hypothetical protein